MNLNSTQMKVSVPTEKLMDFGCIQRLQCFVVSMEVLISILIYIFAILLTRTVGFPHKEANPEIDRYFGNILYSGTAQDKSWNRRFPVLGLRKPEKMAP